MDKRASVLKVCLAFAAAALILPPAGAEYITGFEGLNGSAAGTVLTGQDGFYLPAGSSDFYVFTYPSNALGFPQNPTGENQFIGTRCPAGSIYGRAQRDVSFAECPSWILYWDFCAAFLGTVPATQNLGSFGIRNEGLAVTHYIHLMTWMDPANPTSFNAFYLAYDAGGTQFAQPGEMPGPEWSDLQLNHWYRAWTRIDLVANMITEVGIIDLATGMTATYAPTNWYLAGGSAGAAGPPLSIRFFVGGSTEGNAMGFDNFDVHPEPASPVESATWGQIKDLYR